MEADRSVAPKDPQAARPVALITGASAGIGRAFAEELAARGYDLIIVARRADRLVAVAQRLHAESGVAVEPLVADLAEPAQLATVEERTAGEDRLTLLVNNAGFGVYAPFVETDPDQAEAILRVSVTAPTRLARAALPGMLARGRGGIMNLSTSYTYTMWAPGDSPMPKRTMYVASKAYINAFTELLAHELEGTPVRVMALAAPLVPDTEFHEVAGRRGRPLDPSYEHTARNVAKVALAALEMGELICLPHIEDPSMLAEAEAAYRRGMEQGRSPRIATRYRHALGAFERAQP